MRELIDCIEPLGGQKSRVLWAEKKSVIDIRISGTQRLNRPFFGNHVCCVGRVPLAVTRGSGDFEVSTTLTLGPVTVRPCEARKIFGF